MKPKLLECSIIGVLSMARLASAQEAAPAESFTCTDQACMNDKGLLFVLRTRSYDHPKSQGTGEKSSSAVLQPDRRVTIAREQPGVAVATGRFSVDLPDGGVVWATEDPDLGQPQLSIAAPSFVPFDGTRIVTPVPFAMRSNYPSFIRRLEAVIYHGNDTDLVEPIATVPIEIAAVAKSEWDGTLPASSSFRAGDTLIYVLRAYGEGRNFDETQPQAIQLVTPEEAARGTQQLRETAEANYGRSLTAEEAQHETLIGNVFAENSLRRQNIPIYGSRIRVQGRNLPPEYSLSINGAAYPVDDERKFVAEFLEPVGRHSFDIALRGTSEQQKLSRRLDVDVTGRYFFGLGLADVTVMQNEIDGSTAPFAVDSRYEDDWLTDARLAAYIKTKLAGKYLITAQLDTTELDIEHMFDHLGDATPRDIFRELDADLYYPTYGDDSSTYRDVDTMSRFYVRADWDKNQALWGNYETGFTGTEYAQYVRSLYGGAFAWRSRNNNEWGDANTELRAFGAENETSSGHNEFVGTGGSLYYLRNTNILQGSDIVTLEIRDPTTGRVENRIMLQRGMDYEIDVIQGRIILTRPLLEITRENIPTLTRDAPLDGYEQRLVVDYEWLPSGFDQDDMTAGVRGKQWLGDHIGIGGTYVDEKRDGQDYTLAGGDLTLQAGKGTYLRTEYAQTEAFGTPIFLSDDGGFTFHRTNDVTSEREGETWSVDGRANFRELGWTTLDWGVGGWWRDTSEGYSTNLYDAGFPITEYGGEILRQFPPSLGIYARYTQAESGDDSLGQEQATLAWRIDPVNTLSGEVRRIDEDRPSRGIESAGVLGALKYEHRFGSSLDLYGMGQFTLDDDGGRYADNDAWIAGGTYLFGNTSSINAEVSTGDRGDAGTLGGEYRLSPNHSVYAGYTYSTDTTEYDPLFNSNHQNGWTLGQRWHLNNRTNLYNESQFLKEPNRSGLAHTFGMDFYPSRGWNLGFTVQSGHLIDHLGADVDRNAITLSGGKTTTAVDWQSKVEWREDKGGQQRVQWVTTNRLLYRVNESWRLAARLNYADTDSDVLTALGARFVEGNVGFAYRPWNNSRWALFGRYTYLYDLATLGQEGGAQLDQRSQIFSLEGVFRHTLNWEYALKAARRDGEIRLGRLSADWFDSAANFAAAQVRYELRSQWHALLEYRWLDVDDGGTKQGALIGVDRDLGKNFRIGIGYNFTDFSDDLTDFDYDHQGFFFNGTSRF